VRNDITPNAGRRRAATHDASTDLPVGQNSLDPPFVSAPPIPEITLRGKTDFARRLRDITPVEPFIEKYSTFVFSEIDDILPCLASMRGALRGRHER
jgi:hypothetical protein